MIETSSSKDQFKREYYRQIPSQHYYLNIVRNFGPKLEVYQDRGDRYEKVSFTKVGNKDYWTIPIFTDANDELFSFLKKEYIFI